MWRLMFSARRVTHFGWTKSPNERTVEKKKARLCTIRVYRTSTAHGCARARGRGARGGATRKPTHSHYRRVRVRVSVCGYSFSLN